MSKDYIPRTDADFNQFFKHITQYVAVKCAGSSPEWGHIPKNDRTALNDVYIAWYSAYALTFQPQPKPVIQEKTRQRGIAEKALRHFVNRFLRYEPVTDLDRNNMGIPNRDHTRTPQGEVTKLVAFEAESWKVYMIRAKFWEQGTKRRGKPRGYYGAYIAYEVGGDAIDPEKFTRNTVATKSPHIIKFNAEDRGKTVHMAMRWQNMTGNQGVWSETQSVIVP